MLPFGTHKLTDDVILRAINELGKKNGWELCVPEKKNIFFT